MLASVRARLTAILAKLLPWRRHDAVWLEHEQRQERTHRLEEIARLRRERRGY